MRTADDAVRDRRRPDLPEPPPDQDAPATNASVLDGFDSLRRFERAYPELGAELAAIVRLDPADGGPALLDVLERELRPLRPDLPWPAVDAVRARLARAA